MVSKNFFKVDVNLDRPSQKSIELVRRRALIAIRRNKKGKLDARAVESMLRMVSGRYSDLNAQLENKYREIGHRLDSKFAQGAKEAKSLLIKIEHDIRQLEAMGLKKEHSGIDYEGIVARLETIINKGAGVK